MSRGDYRIFIQARTSSQRLPGKVLKDFKGKPLIRHTIDAARAAGGQGAVMVLTSADQSDDALADYLAAENIHFHRGDLDNVYARFAEALEAENPKWFVRLSGDSPLIAPPLIAYALGLREEGVDIVTNVFPRSFPKGQSVEIMKTETFLREGVNIVDAEDREHVTPYFYRHAGRFDIVNIFNPLGGSDLNYAVDTPEDYAALMTQPVYNPDINSFILQKHTKVDER